jgi:hypothetical protein
MLVIPLACGAQNPSPVSGDREREIIAQLVEQVKQLQQEITIFRHGSRFSRLSSRNPHS